MGTVISVRNLSKCYVIQHQNQKGSDTLLAEMIGSLKKMGQNFFRARRDPVRWREREEFWALKDVSFEVQQGDRLGIVGRNGAGKSTLLKIISRIMEPTSGEIRIKGRVASLLEVGTGFHPELTGRENIYLNGAILGMSRAEIRKKFDEIVGFAEIEKFLDTPVKRYSSGMYVRLAFAVAAHLESEILLVDEVLAVGDAPFQRKCFGKMEEVGREGRTVLFVSHNMGAISDLCDKSILLKSGMIEYQGNTLEAISIYNQFNANNHFSIENCSRRGGSGGIRFKDVWVSNGLDEKCIIIKPNERMSINMKAEVSREYQDKNDIVFGIGIDSVDGRRLFTCMTSWANKIIQIIDRVILIRCVLPMVPLVAGKYLISLAALHRFDALDIVEHCAYFEIISDDGSFLKGRIKEHGCFNILYDFDLVYGGKIIEEIN